MSVALRKAIALGCPESPGRRTLTRLPIRLKVVILERLERPSQIEFTNDFPKGLRQRTVAHRLWQGLVGIMSKILFDIIVSPTKA